jgi:pyruvate dehydrogenase E1 component alpha subunit
MDTYRFRGHSMSDPALYRTKEEVLQKKEIDPVLTMKESLIKDHQILESEIKALETEVKKIIKNAEEFALSSPLPELEELYTEVYL